MRDSYQAWRWWAFLRWKDLGEGGREGGRREGGGREGRKGGGGGREQRRVEERERDA